MEYINTLIEQFSSRTPNIFFGMILGILVSTVIKLVAARSDSIIGHYLKPVVNAASLFLEFLGNTSNKNQRKNTSQGEHE